MFVKIEFIAKVMPESKEVQVLLNEAQTLQKIKRMAYEIHENNFLEKGLVIAGINGEGYALAELIFEQLRVITSKELYLAKLCLDKSALSQPDVLIECQIDTFRKKAVIVVDDVLNTGRTIAFSLRPFLSIPLKRLQVAVLVNRDYLLYPIRANYVGYSLSTSLNDHVEVAISNKNRVGVYLY